MQLTTVIKTDKKKAETVVEETVEIPEDEAAIFDDDMV